VLPYWKNIKVQPNKKYCIFLYTTYTILTNNYNTKPITKRLKKRLSGTAIGDIV
jgi:hypothetical protein